MNGFDYHRYVCLQILFAGEELKAKSRLRYNNLMNVEMYCEKISMESGKMMVEN